MSRAIVYTMKDSTGTQRKIVIDLMRRKDIGENMARSVFLTDSIKKGYAFTDHTVTRTEI